MRFSRIILLSKLCMKKGFSSFRGTNHRQVLFWEGQQATKTDPNSWAASRARSPARECWRDRLEGKLTLKCHYFKNSFPSWASVPCCCQNRSVSGHSSQLQGWSRWKRSSDQVQPARNACCLRREIMVTAMHTPACPKTVWQLSELKYCQVQLHTRVPNESASYQEQQGSVVYSWHNGVLTRT